MGVVGLAGWVLVVRPWAGACREVDWRLWWRRVVVVWIEELGLGKQSEAGLKGRECAWVAPVAEGNSVGVCKAVAQLWRVVRGGVRAYGLL